MQQLNNELGMTFVFSTHDGRVMERARRLIHLRDGKVESDDRRAHGALSATAGGSETRAD